jgi:hypothetical protein
MQGGVIGTRTITRTDSEKKQYEKHLLLLLKKVSVDQLMGVTGLGQSSGQLTPANPSLVKAVATVNSQNLLMFCSKKNIYQIILLLHNH